jgi:flagellar motility protein MotE (MotC chaperone)
VSRKVIIMTTVAGLVSFGGAFVFAWLSNPSAASGPQGPGQPTPVVDRSPPGVSQRQTDEARVASAASGSAKRTLTEQQLKNLVEDVREKIQEYDDRLKAIDMRERRLEVAHNVLKEDIKNLDNLRVEVASAITNLKSERDELLKSRLDIDQKEKNNLISIAATYDKMDVTGAGKILTSLCKPQESGQPKDRDADRKSNSYDDAVKILHYMSERTKAKLLAELATSEPVLAAGLCQRLKQIVEGK